MASFQAKTGRERLRKSENKITVSIISYSTRNRELKKKIQKIKKTPLWPFFNARTSLERPRKSENKIIVLIISYRTLNREFKKRNIKKIQKIKKHHYGFFPSETRLGKADKEWK